MTKCREHAANATPFSLRIRRCACKPNIYIWHPSPPPNAIRWMPSIFVCASALYSRVQKDTSHNLPPNDDELWWRASVPNRTQHGKPTAHWRSNQAVLPKPLSWKHNTDNASYSVKSPWWICQMRACTIINHKNWWEGARPPNGQHTYVAPTRGQILRCAGALQGHKQVIRQAYHQKHRLFGSIPMVPDHLLDSGHITQDLRRISLAQPTETEKRSIAGTHGAFNQGGRTTPAKMIPSAKWRTPQPADGHDDDDDDHDGEMLGRNMKKIKQIMGKVPSPQMDRAPQCRPNEWDNFISCRCAANTPSKWWTRQSTYNKRLSKSIPFGPRSYVGQRPCKISESHWCTAAH